VVNAVDIQLVINGAMGVLDDPRLDVNRDGRVDAVDVQIVINYALGVN